MKHIFIFLLFIFVYSLSAVTQNESQLKKILFKGNTGISSWELKRNMSQKQSSFFSPVTIDRRLLFVDSISISNYYLNNGYLDATVDSMRIQILDSAKVNELVYITEHKRYIIDSIGITGNTFFQTPELLGVLTIQVGGHLDGEKIRTSQLNLLQIYSDMGFLEAKIEFSYTKLPGNFIDLDFILSEGPRLMIDSLRVAGNIKIKEHKIIEAFPFKKDQWIYYNMLLRGQRKLYETGAFSSVSLLLEPSETDPLKRVVVINIKEKKVGIIEGGIGYGTKDGGRVSTGIAHGNISGNASKISSRIGMSRISLNNGFYQFEKNADIAYSNPWILNTMFKGNIGTGVVFLQDTMEYSIEAGLGRSLGDFNDLSFAYRYEYTVREHVASSNNGALLLTFTRDSRDDFFETRHGNFSSFETEYGTPLLGEYHYLKETIETRRYISPSPYKTFAVRLRAGIVTSLLDTLRLPPNTLFFEGGDQSVRGYGYHALNTNAASQGSASSGVSSIEFRQRTGKELLFFNDLGFVFFLDGAILSTYDYKNYSGSFLGAGFGLRASFALGVLRFDLALPLQKPLVKQQGAFYFAFGQSF